MTELGILSEMFLGVIFAIVPFAHKDTFRKMDLYLYLVISWLITSLSMILQDRILLPLTYGTQNMLPLFLLGIPFKCCAYFIQFYGGLEDNRKESTALAAITILFDVCAMVLEQVVLEYSSSLYGLALEDTDVYYSWGASPLYWILRCFYAVFLRLYFGYHDFEQIEDSRNVVIAAGFSILMIATIRGRAQPLAIIPAFIYPLVFVFFIERTILNEKHQQQADAIAANMNQSRTAMQIQRDQAIETLKEHHRQRKETLKIIGLLKENRIDEASALLAESLQQSYEVKVLENECLDAALRYLRAEYHNLCFRMIYQLSGTEQIDFSDLAILITTIIQVLYPHRTEASGSAEITITGQGEMILLHIRTIPARSESNDYEFNQEELAMIRHLIRKYDGIANDGYRSGDFRALLNQRTG
ncbi:hypothetical protein FYJ51_09250 [Erysipelotrichaceae bacterium Oil+RF-744-GAM-WT-6]|uniref:Uncharacterized protein n=1 Tax=Stecheria intestinalis TaxID=2606630 RepID=A0A7X2NTC0_9FIRM|nr:hypothetical protein [Stecheria intestinalis]MSS59085.1 hypothetical protein [Stecheria intestinalis]